MRVGGEGAVGAGWHSPRRHPVARGPWCHLRAVTCAFSAALRVEVAQPPHQTAREGSSSECSSSSPSPMGVQAREESSDSAEENDRRKHAPCGSRCAAPPWSAEAVLTLFPPL